MSKSSVRATARDCVQRSHRFRSILSSGCAIAALAIGIASAAIVPSTALAASPKVIFLTSGSSWTVPSDWNSSSNTIECIGAGGTGSMGTGGAGGAYAKRSNVPLTPGNSVGYGVGTASTTFGAAGGNTWFSSTSTLECAGGGSGGSSAGDITHSGGAGGAVGYSHDGAGGGGAAGPHGNGSAGGSTSSLTETYAGAGGAGDNGNAAGGNAGYDYTENEGNPNGGAGSSEAVWTQTSNGAVAGPGGGGGGSGAGFPNVGEVGGTGGLYGGGSGSPGRGSPDVSTNTAGQQGIIVITYTPSAGGGGGQATAGTTNYTYDANGRLTCTATPDGYFTSYVLDAADNRTQLTRNTTGCVTAGPTQPPVANAVNFSVPYNSTNNLVPLNITGGAAASVAVLGSAAHGSAVASGPTITYTPTNGYSGADSFQYEATNSAGTSSPATVSITIPNTTAPPIAINVNASVGYDSSNTPITLNFGGGTPTGATVSSRPSHGTANVASPTSILYTPTSGYSGSDSFQYTGTNSYGTSAPATVSVTIASGASAPVANNVNATVQYNSVSNLIGLSFGGGAPTSVAVTSSPGHGSAYPNGTSIIYTPTNGYSGSDSFQYTGTNSAGTSSPATASITVEPQGYGQAPVVNNVSATVAYDASNVPISLSISGGAPTSVGVGTPSHGGVTVSGTAVYYTPTQGYSGPDGFIYYASNSAGPSNNATVSITVEPAPAPTTNPISATVNKNSTNNVMPLSITGSPGSVAVSSAPSHGTTSISGLSISYTPANNYSGTDSFQYTATNGAGTSPPATASITVLNNAPTAVNDTFAAHYVGGAPGYPGHSLGCYNPLVNDVSPQGYTLSIVSVGTTEYSVAYGSGAGISGNEVCYSATQVGTFTDYFTYTISDGHGGTSTATETVNVSYP